MEDFFQSLAQAFAHRPGGVWPGALLAGFVVALLALGGVFGQVLGALRGRRNRLSGLVVRHDLEAMDLDLARRLGMLVGVPPADVVANLDIFERATAKALAAKSPAPSWAGYTEDETADRIRRLRGLVGFDRLPPHAPLLTSRELMPGTAIRVDEFTGQVSHVDERAFTVEFLEKTPLWKSMSVELSLVHAREARYELTCAVLAVRPLKDGAVALVFAHDESPKRSQKRAFARAVVGGEIALRLLEPWPTRPPLRTNATLVDVSGGGALVLARTPLPVGALFAASFTVGGERFEAVRAVVLALEPSGASFHAHLEFGPLSESQRERLVTAVERAGRAVAEGHTVER